MKNLFFLLLTSTLLTGLLYSDVETEDIGLQTILTPSNEEKGGPFTLEALGDAIGKSKFKCRDLGHLNFAVGEVDASFIYYYEPCYEEGLNVTLSYERTHLDWNSNPFFNQENIDTISVILGGFSKRLCDWLWQAQVGMNFDNIEYWDFDDYMNYDLLLWGRYSYCKNIGVHIGFLAQTGMKIDRVYPIIGVDWAYNEKFKLNFIFPMNISAIYQFTPSWSVDLAARFFDERHRVKKDEPLSRGLYHYRSTGAELGVNYESGKWLANVHVGSTLGAKLKISDKNNEQKRRYPIRGGAPYVGADLSFKF